MIPLLLQHARVFERGGDLTIIIVAFPLPAKYEQPNKSRNSYYLLWLYGVLSMLDSVVSTHLVHPCYKQANLVASAPESTCRAKLSAVPAAYNAEGSVPIARDLCVADGAP